MGTAHRGRLVKLRCPHCGHAADLRDFANEQAARQVVLIMADLPKSLGRLSLHYIGLFKPAQRSLSWERTLKLLQQLQADINQGRIERHGRIWAAPESLWHQAFTIMLDKASANGLTLPLKNHAYLYEIISSSQSSQEAKAEQEIEQKRQQAQHRSPKKTTPAQTEADKAAGDQAMREAFDQLKLTRKNGGLS